MNGLGMCAGAPAMAGIADQAGMANSAIRIIAFMGHSLLGRRCLRSAGPNSIVGVFHGRGADFIRAQPACHVNISIMQAMRKFVGHRRWSALLSIGVAYALAMQALLASVGFGMSAAETSGQDGAVLCLHASDTQPTTPGGKTPEPRPQCPFCFIAAQSSCEVAAVGSAPILPAYAGLPLAGRLTAVSGDRGYVPQFRRTVGDPRAPPKFSV